MKLNMAVLVVAATVSICGCTSGDTATRALHGAGYKDVEITGYRVFGCSEDDNFHTGFEATGSSGQRVSGVVCSGFFKGATIRTD